jgi:signal transduction histidine kinase
MPSRIRLPRTARQRRAALLVVTGLLAFTGAVFVVVVLGGGVLLRRTDSPHPGLSVAATVVVALAFDPVQRALERWAARLTHGGRSPYEVLRSLSEAAGPITADALAARIARAVVEGTGAPWAEVWLDVRGTLAPAASWPPDAAQSAPPTTALRRTGTPTGPPSGPGTRSAEVRHAGRLLGLLVLGEHDGRPLGPVEDRLVTGLAAQAGLVLHEARLQAERAERLRDLSARALELESSRRRLIAVRDAERRRVERDIHDGAQQHLVALAVNLRLAQAVAGRSPERAEELLRAQAAAARRAEETVVDLARGIYPGVLTDHGLPAALAAAPAGGARVEVEACSVGRYPADVEAAVYFSCLEAVQNAAKHSGAHRVRVRLVGAGGSVAATVDDDGCGFPPDGAPSGAGLTNIRDRIDAVGGVVELGAAPGGGARVALVVPTPTPTSAPTPTPATTSVPTPATATGTA